jgi:hypothetical protein
MFVNAGSRILRRRYGALSDSSYNVTANSLTLSNSSNIKLKGVAFASLPASPVAGQLAFVTDGTAGKTNGQTLTAGSDTGTYLVVYKATNWYVIV